jgi:F-type H+-transporting ATPase subunit gamma
MSDNITGLQQKINSAGELRAVVHTMKAMAAASIGQYEKSVIALKDYYRAVELGLSVCFQKVPTANSLQRNKQQTKSIMIGAVVFGSDQGLVGQFNDVVADHAIKFLASRPGQHLIWAVGERVHAHLNEAHLALQDFFQVPRSLRTITPLIAQILMKTESRQDLNELDELYLFYNHPNSGSSYQPVSRRLLPLDEKWQKEMSNLAWPTAHIAELTSDKTETMRALLREYLFISLFQACTESLASENASRLAAMQRAEKNIDELLEELNNTFHRLRQSSIDEELFDVLSGYESLTKE